MRLVGGHWGGWSYYSACVEGKYQLWAFSVPTLTTFRITGSFGAMIMILALLLSPFAQQIIAYRVRIVLVDDGAMTRRALNYDLALTEGNGIIPALSMKAAVYDGLFAAGSRLKKSSLECATGNCAFGEIETLAVCQSCIDMSAHMTRYCPNGTPAGGDMSNCGWQLPSGAMLNSSSDVFSMTPLVSILPLPQANQQTNAPLVPQQN